MEIKNYLLNDKSVSQIDRYDRIYIHVKPGTRIEYLNLKEFIINSKTGIDYFIYYRIQFNKTSIDYNSIDDISGVITKTDIETNILKGTYLSGGLSNGDGNYYAFSFEISPIPEEAYRSDNIYYRLEGKVFGYVREIVGGSIVNSYYSGSTISLKNSIGEIISEETSNEYGKFVLVYETFDKIY